MTAQLSRIVYRIGSPENDQHHFTEQKDHADIAKNNGYEVSEYVLAGMDSKPVGFIHPFTPFTFGKSCGAIFQEETRHYNKAVYTAPPAPVAVREDLRNRLKAEGVAEVLKEASEYAPLTAEQWVTLTNNVHQTLIGLAEGYAEFNACRAAMLKAGPVTAATVEGRNPVLAYADSYRDMAKKGVELVQIWSVITDLERNIAPLFTAPASPEQEV